MHIKNKLIIPVLLTFLSSTSYSYADETTWEWDLRPSSNGNSCSNNCPTTNFSVSDVVDNESVTANLTAWSDTQGSHGDSPNRDPEIDQADMYFWGDRNGWGAVNSDEGRRDNPGHAFDNMGNPGYIDYDMVLVSFDTSVALTGIDFGWVSDGDFSLLAYTGDGSFSENDLNGSTWANQQNSGNWLTVGQYNGGVTDQYYAVNTANQSSHHWLIGAYNSVFGAAIDSNIDDNDDAFKLKKLQGTTTEPNVVAAPSTLALMLLSFIGIAARRRKLKAI
jgi:hypothetical protein